jgi:hypothetical protein
MLSQSPPGNLFCIGPCLTVFSKVHVINDLHLRWLSNSTEKQRKLIFEGNSEVNKLTLTLLLMLNIIFKFFFFHDFLINCLK